jgi:nucleoside-diphosphate-sugar epimerase
MREPDGAHVFNLVGEVASNEDVVAAIREIVPDANIRIKGPGLPITSTIEEGDLRKVLNGLPRTGLRDGVRRTIDHYRHRKH